MKKILSISILVFTYFSVFGQVDFNEVLFSHQIEKQVADGTLRSGRAGLKYSLIGEYYNSISYSEVPVSWGVDSLDLSNYEVVDAFDKIIEKAKNEKLVIISEGHLKPQHRIFANKIITELAKHGFNQLGMETLQRESETKLLDSTLMERGYPLKTMITGTYTAEPQMGNLVRDAIKSGYQLFPYERNKFLDGKEKDRDEIQAELIIQHLAQNPNSKTVILCGFHHAIESDILKRGRSFWMAKYIKDKTDIDPLTIYQDNFTEQVIEDEHPILSKLIIDKPSVFVDNSNQIVRLTDAVDIEVVHPKTIFKNGRPNWINSEGLHQEIEVELSDDTKFPILASAFPTHEENSTPVDRIEVKYKYDNKILLLKPGKYRIEIYDGEKTSKYEKVVE